MPKNPKNTDNDIEFFHQAMKGTKRLSQKKIRLAPPPLRTRKPSPQPTHSHFENLGFNEKEDLPSVSGEEFIAYKQEGISNKTLRKLRKGQYNVEATLDLHGMSTEDAITMVDNFLQQCLHDGMRVVLIIHGKGRHSQAPILKNKLNHWLRKIDSVLAFCSAAPTHGSRGACYVLLRRITEEVI